MTPVATRTATLPDARVLLLSLIADGLTDAQIGRAVGLTGPAIRKRLTRLLVELEVESRGEAVARAYRDGWLRRVPASPWPMRVSARQSEVLRMYLAGMTDRRIAAALGISPATLREHWKRLYFRLGATNRAHAVRLAVDAGAVAVPLRQLTEAPPGPGVGAFVAA